MFKKRNLMIAVCIVMCLGLLVVGCSTANKEPESSKEASWPEKPVEIIIPVPAGADIDSLTRIIGEELRKEFGQPFFVTNMPGGALTIGTEKVAKSAPDGYTLLATPLGGITMQPQYRELPYKYTDLEPISLLSIGADVLYTKAGKFKDLEDLVSYIKENPGKVKYGVAAVGALAHISTEDLLVKIGGEGNPVGFEGDADCLMALLGGHIDFAFIGGTAYEYVKSGDLTPLAVGTPERVSVLPDCPTFKELGYDVSSDGWQGFLAPKGIPEDIADKLNKAINSIIERPEITERITGVGRHTKLMSREEFKQFIEADFNKYNKIINESPAGEKIKKMMAK
ncbi:MAG: tripartite tricarboxylate transporter substrate binding protein [Peptococcales bacterium]|jgi:tripartite-type tricarboxylate transporter receptor subunit TctC